jgi:Tol biopolymer transport system component
MNAIKISILGCLLLLGFGLNAQYFGQNKPLYENFEFEVSESPNFEIYHYLDNDSLLQELAKNSEQWYHFHQHVLKDTFTEKNPIIFYNDHADFQQTNTIGGQISVGTGGVTEGLRNRVIMPLAMTNQQTNHVLGHELVHAFQYHMIINGDSTSIRNLANLPLWMVEGLAEYLSIGSVDAHTAMWMRDAVLNDDIPSIKKLNNPKYFPYRWGQAFWAFLTGWKGDQIIEPFFMGVAKYGFDQASVQVLGLKTKDLSELWVNSIKQTFGDQLDADKERTVGKKLISRENGGRMNVGPVISPNGRHVIFLSEKDLFTTDLYLADARSGEIIRKVASAAKDGHIDDFNYIESAGTWSPNSKKFAYVAFSKGQNILVIKDVESGKTLEELALDGVPAISNPAWSPDGKEILVVGLVNGQTDLYSVRLSSGKVKQLTNNKYSEMHPTWSADGQEIIFSTDQLSFARGRKNGKWNFNIAIMNLEYGSIEQLDFFPGADNLNPVLDTAQNILFLSNRDGFRNIYKYDRTSKRLYQLTDLLTGVSGITHYAPALSVDRKRDRVVYSHYLMNGYDIYAAKPEAFLNREANPQDVDMTAATLPQLNKKAPKLVDTQLALIDAPETSPDFDMASKPYQSKFELEYVSNSGIGVGVGSSNAFGTTTGLAGGVDLLFGDILGDHKLLTSISLNGEITDFGGAVAYLNQKHKIKWGASLSHSPFRSVSGGFVGVDTIPINEEGGVLANHYIFDNFRIFEDRVGVFGQLPFSKTFRVEAGANFSRYSFRIDRFDNYYDAFGRLIFQEREKLDAPPGFNLWSVNAAVVSDNSSFGITAPLRGHRYRLGVERYGGEFNYMAATADFRVYKYLKPVTLAFRGMHYGRYGAGSDELFPLYVGSPWYVRGYNTNAAQSIFIQNGKSIDLLLGSKLLVSNFEVRIPFTGPERLSLLKSGFLLTDLNFFVDGGVAFNDFSQFGNTADSKLPQAEPVFSAGASVRINFFGAMVLEPYYAFPLQKNTRGVFGLNIIPGW